MEEVIVQCPDWNSRLDEFNFVKKQIERINELLSSTTRGRDHWYQLYYEISVFINTVTIVHKGHDLEQSRMSTYEHYMCKHYGDTMEESINIAYSDLINAHYKVFLLYYAPFICSRFTGAKGFGHISMYLMFKSAVSDGNNVLEHFHNELDPAPIYQ